MFSPNSSLLAALACAVLLASCSGGAGERALVRYLDRLGRTLQQEVPVEPAPDIPLPPRSGALRIALRDDSLGTLDFLALTGCAVQVTIGKRNSSLGRVASDSQRLLLDLEYLQLAPPCIALLRERRPGLAKTLAEAQALKRKQLPARIFNATLGGPEYRRLWLQPAHLADYPRQTGSAPLGAMAAVNGAVLRWLGGDYRFDNRDFEIQLSGVAAGDGGHLLRALALQQSALAAADRMAARRLAQGPLCLPGLRPAAADILDNVMRRYFIGEVQPWAAAVNRRLHEVLPPVRELEELLGAVLPEEYRGWRTVRDAKLAAWAGAPRRHAAHLQRLREPCMLR